MKTPYFKKWGYFLIFGPLFVLPLFESRGDFIGSALALPRCSNAVAVLANAISELRARVKNTAMLYLEDGIGAAFDPGYFTPITEEYRRIKLERMATS